ncbi:sugar ABC transporter substrate-binding protein [Nocardioides sp. J54]|uniref:sugar ABC transporter substrate-binding protein n=1 Tax=Nocardioides sp. J54 TaxID=935866 RepID=UPI00048A766D|nr:sugar ABC transporter substrate-binding protein [Nocardioides sp. J54]
MMSRRLAAGLSLTALSLVVAACGGESSAEEGADERYTIGIVQFSSSDETTETVIRGYVEYAEEQGWEYSKVDPQGSVDRAISAMNDFVQKGVDAIVVSVFPSDSLTAGVRAASAADIPVISIVGGTAEGVPMSADAGRPNAEEISDLLIDDLGGSGEVLVLGYSAGLPCVGREEQLMDALDGTDIEVTREEVPIPGQVEAGTRIAQGWLADRPKGSGPLAVWGCFDDPSLGAVSALRQADRDDVLVYGINGTPAAVRAVRDGDMRATAFADAFGVGRDLAEQTPAVIEAGPGADARDVPLPTFLVTEDTYDEFATTHPEAVK